MRVQGKMAFITGAASGLGKASAMMLAREGAKVALSDINEDGVKAAADEINKKYPGQAFAYRLDVTHEAWKAVGVGWLYAPLRWPLIRHVADAFYNVFAKHRYTISYLLTGKKRQCDRCIPGEPNEK